MKRDKAMGWTSRDRMRDKTVAEQILYENRNWPGVKILAHGTKGGAFYAAVKNLKTQDVFAYVVAYDVRRGYYGTELSTKDMDETMGPVENKAPRKVLALLTPIDSKYANEWRAECWENVRRDERVPKKGDTVIFERPIHNATHFTYLGNRGFFVTVRPIGFALE